MNIVFITHYFPPLNSSGARRVQAFAKYLASWGHQITVITPHKTTSDGWLTEEVPHHLRLLELDSRGRLSPSLRSSSPVGGEKKSVESRSAWGRWLLKIKRAVMQVSGQLIDHRLVFALQFAFPWITSEVKQALAKADVVMSSCPPWTSHLAGRLVQARYGKPWVADYRDQFSGNHILRGSFLSRPVEVWLERWLLKRATYVVAISGPMKEYYEHFHSRVACIENGYDESVFEQAREQSSELAKKEPEDEFVIRYLGTITGHRIPVAFFQALALLNQSPGRRMVAEFYGESTLLRKALPELVAQSVPFVRFCPQLPYGAAIQSMLTADAHLFIETSNFSSYSARGVLTTKLFEYFAARKPIVAEISPRALASQYIARSGLGVVISEDADEILRGLQNLRAGQFEPVIDDAFIQSLSRLVKAKELEQLFVAIVAGRSQVSA